MNEPLATAGGLFFFLTFCHFVADWVFQSHEVAMNKHEDRLARLFHVACYLCCMYFPFALVLDWRFEFFLISMAATGATHYIGDSHWPVLLWARLIRRIPEEQYTTKEPLTLILCLVIDQLWHLLFLLVPVALAVWG